MSKVKVKPYNMDIGLHYNNHFMAIIVHNFLTISNMVLRNESLKNNMVSNNYIMIDEDDSGNDVIFISLNKERYDKYFAPKSSAHYEKELARLTNDGIIIKRKGHAKINYYRINTEHPLIKQAYNNVATFDFDRSHKMVKPREGIASMFQSWDAAILIEIIHRYPLLHKMYNKVNYDDFLTAFFWNGDSIVVNTDTDFFKKIIPLKLNSGEIIKELTHPDINFLCPVDKNMIAVNYENLRLREFSYITPIVYY